MLRRREFLLSTAPAILRAAGQRPNVLWLMTDEHRPDSLGCYGSPWGRSPHLDNLAAGGTLFLSAYTPSPVCVPCRSSLLTGNSASTTGVLHNEAKLSPETRFLTWRFEDAGYQTASFGKKHYFFAGARQAFQTEGGRPTDGIVDPARYGKGYDPAQHDVVQYPVLPKQKIQRRWILGGQFPASEDETAEARNVSLATQWLDGRDPAKPFLLRLSLNAPHTPVVVPAKYLAQVDPNRIRIPSPTQQELDRQPERERVLLRSFEGSDALTADQLRKAQHYYYARCAFADAMCGRLLDWMRTRGLLDNTIVVMTADHGTHLGDHGLLQKQTFYEQVATVPYIFHAPGLVRRGARLQTPVSTLGLLPTLLDLAGLPSGNVEGTSLAPSLRKGTEPPRRPVVSEIAFGYQGWRDQDRQVMIRDGHLKLSLFSAPRDPARFAANPDGALYDLRQDPHETRNLFAGHGRQADIQRLLRHLAGWDARRLQS
ncbi:MAG: sulfatase-like hydrolase/transferase [Bryobacterales bacterium]|nr:sulfatase-like hydrolase/transferase [Bryobacterales bacterium]